MNASPELPIRAQAAPAPSLRVAGSIGPEGGAAWHGGPPEAVRRGPDDVVTTTDEIVTASSPDGALRSATEPYGGSVVAVDGTRVLGRRRTVLPGCPAATEARGVADAFACLREAVVVIFDEALSRRTGGSPADLADLEALDGRSHARAESGRRGGSPVRG